MAAVVNGVAVFSADLREFFTEQLFIERKRDRATVVELGPEAQPLPELRTRDFRRGEILHQVVNWLRTRAPEPRFEIANANVNVPAHAVFCDRAVQGREQ